MLTIKKQGVFEIAFALMGSVIMKKYTAIFLLATIFILFAWGLNRAQDFPKPQGFVNDFAQIIPQGYKTRFEGLALELKQKTGAELVVATMPDIGGEDAAEYANKLFSAWGIGEKDKDNGVLLFLTMQERKVRIEVGYGLEGILPDGLVGEILDTRALPFFKKGDYGKGLYEAAMAVASTISRDAGVTLTKAPGTHPRNISERPPALGNLLGSIIPLLLLFFIIGGRMGILPWLLLGGMMSGRGYSGFGGGFGSGGFGGGFSGFGGGLSGGGGAGRGF